MSEQTAAKVTGAHLARTAYLYVRQSTLRQVLTNTESAARQYALRQKAIALGWPAEQIVTIDTDQGQSGATAADREGFQRLVAEVGMGRAGIVLGLEVSRLARNNADWHRLLEICAMSATLICDEDGLYDPTDFNDRLLLGLKGTMSEAELHFIRARLIGGQLSKARRGELQMAPAGRAGLRPGRQGRARPRHRCATSHPAPVHPVRPHRLGPRGRAAVQRRRAAVPGAGPHRRPQGRAGLDAAAALAGAAHPAQPPLRRRVRLRPPPRTPRRRTARRPTRLVPREQWIALIPDAHPGYISWDQYETNQKLLLGNATAHGDDRAAGPAREGTALLQGLAICGRCGRRMTVRYHTRRGVEIPDYQCMNRCIQDGAQRCQSVPGGAVDAAVATLLLDTLTPLALEVALTVQAELDTRAAEADALRRRHVERARHRADLARRRYLAVDPDNRLVADSLEADWNDALRALQTAHDDYERASAAATATLTDELQGPNPFAGNRLPRPLVQPGHPAARTQTHGPPPDRRRHPAQDRPASTCTSASAAGRPPASPSRSRPMPGKPAKPTPTPSPRSTGSSTPTPTPRPPKHSTPPVTAPARASRSPHASSFTSAASTIYPATPTGSAPKACSPQPRLAQRLDVHPSTIKSWTKRRNPQLPQGKRQERTALRTTRPPATPASPPDKAAR